MKEKNENLIKTIRFPKEIKEKIQKSAEKETRTFSAQVIHIIKKYYEMQEKQWNEVWIWTIKE